MAMYKIEQLIKYKYFARLLETTGLEHITDPLTGIISRAYILGFAKSLIAEKIPFSFVMLDLDNFKFVNDTYGHSAGDGILKGVSAALADYIDGFGIAGRFGGDELIFIDLKHLTYDDKKSFFTGMYTGNRLLRRNYDLETCSPLITATIGCATYPTDSEDYDELFSMIDKTLYRGKNKGRNCYIIYVEEKHRNIEIKKLAGHGICTIMQSLIRQFELVPGLENKFHAVIPLLMEEIGITDLYYSDSDNIMHAVLDKSFREYVGDIGQITKDDIYRTNELSDIRGTAPVFYEALKKHNVETLLVIRIGIKDITDGYLICAEPRSHRIWQEDECSIIYFLAKLIASEMRLEELPFRKFDFTVKA
ncbi:MAG: GGDEF domain-containing protein [Ruminiclostridium sp.]|nr:GGDEF domain-containing protein [Ruminiclostridium sp.]